MLNIALVSIGLTLVIALSFYLILGKNDTTNFRLSDNSDVDNVYKKLLNTFGGDLLALLPDDYADKRRKDKGLELLFKKAKNPWNITPLEYHLLKIILTFIGVLAGTFLGGILGATLGWFFTPLVTFATAFALGSYPYRFYVEKAITRENKFKANIPEAIDYLTMSMAGGKYSLASSFERTIAYLDEGPVKEEFVQIVNDLRVGKTMEQALNDFADRIPIESIKTFAKALNNADKQSVSMIEMLMNRAKESRKELNDEIDRRIQSLPTKVMVILGPASLVSILIVALAPAILIISNVF